MAKFSLERDEEEEIEESSSTGRPRHKKHKRVINDANGSEGNLNETVVEPYKEESGVSVTLTDPEVLDCSICMEILSPPVFQCENGHIACSPCCSKLQNKCPSCSWPIGYNRCLAIEKVIESIRVSCGYKPYGCEETLSYPQKHKHEETCTYAPCTCPMSDCNFRGSSKQLFLHFSNQHWSSARSFEYNRPFLVSFGKFDPYLVFQGEEDDTGPLFVMNNQVELIGNAITVACFGVSSSSGGRGFSYDLIAKKEGSTLRLQAYAKCVKERAEVSRVVDFLLVPFDFCSSSGKLRLEICIWSGRGSE